MKPCVRVGWTLSTALSPGSALPAAQKEQSEVFFSVTKLFQNKDVNLRRMVRL